ncbi:phosphoenolpyruvate--protein phosphotransferase [Endothiovibrio diazotrophicus]
MTLSLTGIGVSRGVAIGQVHRLRRDQLEIPMFAIPMYRLDEEEARYRHALEAAKGQLRAIRERIPAKTPADIGAFIDTHLLMLEDTTFSEAPIKAIREERLNAEWALKQQRDTLVQVFEEMDDAYLRTRKDDVQHVADRVLRVLLHQEDDHHAVFDANLKDRIILADDLTPADTLLMQHQGIAGFITESGGPLSHTAILARSLRIPAIVGVRLARRYLRADEMLIIDGAAGVIIADTDDYSFRHYRKRQREERRHQSELQKLKASPTVTTDGAPITLLANIELPEDIRAVRRVNAAGIGLYRTEFLYMNRDDLPEEAEHYKAYLKVVKAMKGAPVTFRTFDLGADKQPGGGRNITPNVTNPALGLRAIRLCLKEPQLFIPQLRALLRVSAYGPVKVMFPMLSNSLELFQVLQLVEETKEELRREGKKFDEAIELGGMIEVPAAAITAASFAEHLDFLSIGTNDLIQYTLAIDRVDDEVNYLYDPLHPAVLRLIRMTIEAGQVAGIPVSMCGEMAGDPRYTKLLLGMGLEHFSMHPASLLEVKGIVNACQLKELRRQADRLLTTSDPLEMAEALARIIDH